LNHDFQDAYSHLHLTPPQYKKILTVSNEMERYLEMPPMQEDKAVFIHSDCGHERGTFVSKMIQEGIIPIDRYGKCWRNKDIKTIEPPREKWYWGDSQGNRDTTKTDVFTGYKFSFALENTKSRDYFTEKRYQSFLALTVPIVWKNDNSEQYTPGENSVIYPEDHDNDPTELAKYLLRLTTDDKAYQKHMAWKKKGIRREFVKTLFKKTDFMACRICEKVSKKTKSIKYVVVIPSVKRNNDEYLIKTLDSLERARPTDVPVLLVNANQPATKHTYLREWCSSHEKYKCINPPKVPESLIKEAISNDKRGDTPQYLRWRTMETMHAMFGMTEFLKTGAEYMVWLQDDVTVDEDLFSSLPDEEIVCLRSDGYCGMVAYMFKKSFVQKLIPRLERDYKDMPIDWIVDKTRGKDVVRIPKAYHHGIKSSNGKKRESTKIEAKMNAKAIQTTDLFAAIDYNAPENRGPWKQGWDYKYDDRFKDGLTIHVVPHSHNDPGWIKTYHTYYSTQTRQILDTVIAALTEDPRRTFIWAEISYFSLWWDDTTSEQKEQAKKLVAEKRLDFVTGGWVMNDEASVTARATRWHLQEGREWLQNTFGITPQYSWAIDPFGHSAGQAQVLKELGYKGMLIQRVHYAVKKQLAQKQQLEFQWQTPAGEIFTHMMPFYSYDGPHTCGPDPSVCCQFDFARIGKGKTWTGCPWGKMAVEITEHNVAERSKKWLDQVYKKAMLYRGKHVLVPVGDDFRYQTMDEAHKQFTNYQRMFDWIKINVPSVKASFSTLTQYFDVAVQTQVPKLQGSFFPYSDREKDYWTGYFNSRIFYKGYDRLLESLIAAVETKCPTVDVHLQKRALGLFQHHDGITGTAKSHVVQDYYQTMQKAVTELKTKLKTCLNTNILGDIKSKASIIYYNNGCNKNWLKTMGYTGECVQHDSIMESFERLHYDYKVTEKTPNCLAGQRNAILLVSSGHSVAKQFVDCFKKVYLLDWFGTSKDMTPRGVILLNAMRKGVGQFLGYTLQPPLKDTRVKPRRQAYGILLGKLPRYWIQKKHLLSKMSDVKFACVTCDIEMKNVVNHKRLPRGEYIKLTSEATFLLGAGHPIGSPSVLEALQNGLTIILPKIQHYKMGVTHATQHDDIHAIMNEQPEVRKRICYYENDEKMVECVRSAQKYPPLTLISYTRESFDMRMKTFFGQTNANGHILVNPLSIDTPTMKADEIRPYEEDVCVPTAGLQFFSIKIDDHGHVIQINETPVHESLVWRSNKPGPGVAGAYLMAVTSTKDILRPTKHTTCIAKMYKQLETTFDMLKRRIRVYNDGTIEFIYDADIRARNNGELWAVYKPEWSAERLCSDVHGLTWECHAERRDAPLQAKFWPMPTMAWLASSTDRMTFTGAQPTGVGFHEGAMVLMLDRRGNQDDARGLGQGITDSRPVEMRFGVVMESEISAKHASTKALAIRNWMLNPEIVLHGPSQNVLQNSKRPPKFITFLKNILLQNKLDVKELNGKLKVSQTSTTKTFKCTIDVEKINLKQTKKWSDIFETNPNSLVGSTPFTVDEIKEIQKRSLLPKDDVPIYIIARDNKNVDTGGATIIRFNSHDNEKRTTMRFTWGQHLSDFVHKFNEGPQKLIKWVHPPYMLDYGFWNTSSPLVVPRNQWKLNQLRQTLKAQTPLYFLKSSIWSGKKSWMVDCPLVDGVGAIVTGILIELKAPKMLVGVSTTSDEYNFYDNNVGEPTLRNRWRLMLYNNIFNALLKYK
jgi:hypothetical protein